MEFRLRARDRAALEEIVARSKDVRQLKRAQAILEMSSGATVVSVAKKTHVVRNAICNLEKHTEIGR